MILPDVRHVAATIATNTNRQDLESISVRLFFLFLLSFLFKSQTNGTNFFSRTGRDYPSGWGVEPYVSPNDLFAEQLSVNQQV